MLPIALGLLTTLGSGVLPAPTAAQSSPPASQLQSFQGVAPAGRRAPLESPEQFREALKAQMIRVQREQRAAPEFAEQALAAQLEYLEQTAEKSYTAQPGMPGRRTAPMMPPVHIAPQANSTPPPVSQPAIDTPQMAGSAPIASPSQRLPSARVTPIGGPALEAPQSNAFVASPPSNPSPASPPPQPFTPSRSTPSLESAQRLTLSSPSGIDGQAETLDRDLDSDFPNPESAEPMISRAAANVAANQPVLHAPERSAPGSFAAPPARLPEASRVSLQESAYDNAPEGSWSDQGSGKRLTGQPVSVLANRPLNGDRGPAAGAAVNALRSNSAAPGGLRQDSENDFGNQDPTNENLPVDPDRIDPAPRPFEPGTNDLQQEDVRLQCDQYRSQLLGKSIRTIALDLSPRPDLAEAGNPMIPISRSWTDRQGRIIATGKMLDLRRGYVILDTDQGRLKIPYAKLSDADWAAVAEYWQIPQLCGAGATAPPSRNWVPQTYTWTASALCHKPLYFENRQLERYGHSHGPVLQPIHSTAHFFVRLATLPYQTAIHPPNECMYALGYYRPGNCAPWLKDPVPISLGGLTRQALITTGVGVIP